MSSRQAKPARAGGGAGRRRRTRRGLLLTALPIIALITVLGIALAVTHRDSATADRKAEVRALADAAATNAARFLDDRFAVLETISATRSVREGDVRRMGPFLRRVAAQGRFSSNLAYVDRSGRVRVSTALASGFSLADRPYVAAALAGRQTVSDVLLGKVRGTPILAFGQPVHGPRGAVGGALVGSIRLDELGADVERLLYAPGAGELILDGRNRVLVDERPVRGLLAPPDGLSLPRLRRSGSGVLDGVQLRGRKRLAAYAGVRGTGWLVVVSEPYADTIAPLDRALAAEIAALLVLALLGVLSTYAAAGRLDRLERERETAFEQQRMIAAQLQQSMLPAVPVLAGVEVGAGYAPAQDELSVGGDWYDVVGVGDGCVALSVGDVSGHGLAAAAVMGQLRSAARTLSLGRAEPGEALRQLDGFTALLDGRPLATVVQGRLDPADGALRYACAGHPPPLLLRADGAAEYLDDGRSALLGVDPDAPRPEGVAHLAPGDTLVVYTDGLIERPDSTLDAGMATLAALATSVGTEPVGLADALLDSVAQPRRDDVAVLCVRRSQAAAGQPNVDS